MPKVKRTKSIITALGTGVGGNATTTITIDIQNDRTMVQDEVEHNQANAEDVIVRALAQNTHHYNINIRRPFIKW